MRAKCRHIVSLFLTIFLLLFCVACGQNQAQPEDTGDKDQYMTDPIPEGRPTPVEPQDTTVDILARGPEMLHDFDGELFGQLIDKVIIESNASLRFRLKNGLELRESIERTVR